MRARREVRALGVGLARCRSPRRRASARDSRSASEYATTASMPSTRQARRTRSAISPRLAMRMRLTTLQPTPSCSRHPSPSVSVADADAASTTATSSPYSTASPAWAKTSTRVPSIGAVTSWGMPSRSTTASCRAYLHDRSDGESGRKIPTAGDVTAERLASGSGRDDAGDAFAVRGSACEATPRRGRSCRRGAGADPAVSRRTRILQSPRGPRSRPAPPGAGDERRPAVSDRREAGVVGTLGGRVARPGPGMG